MQTEKVKNQNLLITSHKEKITVVTSLGSLKTLY